MMRINKNVLFVGPSGCGKTYMARNIAKGKPMLFLHMNENSSYESLVEGIQIDTKEGELQYSQKPQVILEYVNSIKAEEEYYLILDDINRADISAVLGELYYALANREEYVTLKSGKRLSIPNNLTLIATMCSSDMHSIKNSVETLFDHIIHVDNSIEKYAMVLNDMKDDSTCTLSQNEFDDLVEQLKKEYQRYKKEYCVFTKEYESERRAFELGFGYFLPARHLSAAFWGDCIQNKIRHQVRPLLEQYAADGVIKGEYIPDESINDTKFVVNQIKEEHITVDRVPHYAKQEDDAFLRGLPLPHGAERNGNLKANPRYIIISAFLQEMIRHSLINQMDLFDMLTNDEEILTFRNDIAAPNGRLGGRLLVADSERTLFHAIDSSNRGEYTYSDTYHVFIYKGIRYRLFSAYASSDNCPYKIEKCIHSDKGSQRRQLYHTMKMLVYKYFKKYRMNLENYLLLHDDVEIKTKLSQVCKDIEFVKQITTDKKYIGQPFYITVGTAQDCMQMVNLIRALPTWQMMLREKGVYRTMSTDYMQIMKATDVRQMILQGPPGTSKTYGAKKFLCKEIGVSGLDWEEQLKEYQLIVSDTDENEYEMPRIGAKAYWDIVQFHPSYTYEDFVRGITVYSREEKLIAGKVGDEDIVLVEKDTIGYKSVNKAIGKMAKLANDCYQEAIESGNVEECPKFFLVIDEINRANLATVFGELIFALEYRDKEVNTPYSVYGKSELVIPKNMYIIGTMNTADKSIGTIDYAIRRRFLFFKMLPNIKVVMDSIKKIDDKAEFCKCDEVVLFYIVDQLFEECLNSIDYDREDVQLGHTYFLRHEAETSAEDQIKYKFIYQVLPILYEYKKDGIVDFDRIKMVEGDILRNALEKVCDLVMAKDEDREVEYIELIKMLKDLPDLQERIKEYIKKNVKEDVVDE